MINDTFHIDTDIIDRCRRGDAKAQFILYKQYSKAMYNIAIRFTNNKMDAEDILQDSFVMAFEKLPGLQDTASFPAWLKKIVVNKCIDQIRKNRISFENLDENMSENHTADDEPDFTIDPAIVHNSVKNLPGGSRTILILHALEGYKHREIASMLGISESTSKSQYPRALGLLNRDLKQKIYVT
jgi:RNA polymerase sigma factor (sigma-70 family)